MTLTRKDAVATALTVLVVLVFLTTHEGWGVWLIGSSHRWATGAIALLGMATCGLGSPGKGAACGVRKSDPQAARLYSWISPPRRSFRRSWCGRDALTSRGVIVFGSGGVRSSDLCGLWPL